MQVIHIFGGNVHIRMLRRPQKSASQRPIEWSIDETCDRSIDRSMDRWITRVWSIFPSGVKHWDLMLSCWYQKCKRTPPSSSFEILLLSMLWQHGASPHLFSGCFCNVCAFAIVKCLQFCFFCFWDQPHRLTLSRIVDTYPFHEREWLFLSVCKVIFLAALIKHSQCAQSPYVQS